MTDRGRTLGGLSAHALKDALHRLRSLADDGADVAERSAFATQRLHLGDNFLLFTVRNEPLDLAIHDDFRAEWPFAPAEHVLSGQMALGVPDAVPLAIPRRVDQVQAVFLQLF